MKIYTKITLKKLFSFFLTVSLLAGNVRASPVIKRDSDQKALESLAVDGKIVILENELQKLQKDLETFRKASKDDKPKTEPSKTVAETAPKADDSMAKSNSEDGLAGFGVEHKTPGEFLDKPVEVPLERRSEDTKNSKKSIGWQPLKKRVIENHMEKEPTFRLSLHDNQALQKQLMETVEKHLLDDLRAAQKYGIEPEQILTDLRQKNTRDGNKRHAR